MTLSREVLAIITYVESSGLPYRVTDTVGPGHAAGSYHYALGTEGEGLAVDFGGVAPGVTATTAAQMLDLYRLFLIAGPQLAELIYSGSNVREGIKDGRLVRGASFFGPVVWPDHRDHVHVAVPKGVFLKPLSHPIGTIEEEVVVADNPDLANIEGPLQLQILQDQNGNATGYAIFSTATGELHGYGPGWKYYGRSEDPTP